MLQAVLTRCPVKVMTAAFVIHAQFEPVGPVTNFLNDVNQAGVPFLDATMYDWSGKLKPAGRPMVVIRKTLICALYPEDAKIRGAVQLLKRVEKIIIHVPHLVCRGEIHVGPEARPQDMVETSIGQFIALTNASLFPTSPLPAEFPSQVEMFFLHKDAVLAYYPE
jgi:hypothetical protein